MNEERWERVHQVLEGALELPVEARRAFVTSSCAGDEALRDEVLSLLAADVVDDLPTHWLGAIASPDADRIAPGDLLANRYRIKRRLGRGGMGEVYGADDEELGIPVAIKRLRDLGPRQAAADRLKLEGLLARAVWHPNVCRVYEVGHDDDLWFLAMECLEGPTLEERLRETGPLSLDQALRIAGQVGAGLGAAHRAGVIHRDLKPANVMLVPREGVEQAVVTDFGTGRSASPGFDRGEERGGMVVGTPAYMAPEQVRGEEVGPAADIFALGLVLLRMVTGALPQGALESTALMRHRREEDVLPAGAIPGLDSRWEAVIRRCLERDPRRRFAHAEHVAEALLGRAPVELASGPARWSSFPSERDPFVGRGSDLEELERGGARLRTLVGPGGMGKTRLAIRFGRATADAWPGGAFFCDLTEARDVNDIAAALGRALGVQLVRGDTIRQLGHALASRGQCLVVFDNFEQVVAHAAATLGRWHALASDATFLVTSRQRLGLPDEQTRAVEPLTADEGLELFTLRARGLSPGLRLEGEEKEAARELVRLLDGIPLAIELAAARITVMSVPRIVEGMRKRFRLLAGGREARHETLEGTIDESWELLAPWERSTWAQCAVFEGGWTLAAAAAVLELDEAAPPVVDILRSLVDKSLVRTWAPPGSAGADVRFGMYVTLQEYARSRLRAALPETEARHGVHYSSFGTDEALEAVDRHGGAPLWRRLERELDNLIVACRRAILRGDGATVVATYRAASRVLKARGPLDTALALGNEALAAVSGADRAIVAVALGEAEWYAGRYEDSFAHCESACAEARAIGDLRLEARAAATSGRSSFVLGRIEPAAAALTAALAAARAAGDRSALGNALNGAGMLHHEIGETERARADYEEALAIARDLGDRAMEAVTLLSLGILHHKRGDFDRASATFEEALAIHLESGNRRSEGIAHMNLTGVRTDQGRMADARVHAEAALAIARSIGSRVNEGNALAALGEMYADMGQADEARASFEAALTIHRDLGDRRIEGMLVANLARLDELHGEFETAIARYESALALHREVGDRHFEAGALTGLAHIYLSRGARDDARAALAAGEPILRAVHARQELARMLCIRAELEHAEGDTRAAQAALEEAEALAAGLDPRPESQLGQALAHARRTIAGT